MRVRARQSAAIVFLVLVAGCSGTDWRSTEAASEVTTTTAPSQSPATETTPTSESSTLANPTWAPYTDPSGLTLEHPRAWTVQPAQLGPFYMFIDDSADSGGFRRNVNVLVQQVPPSMTLDEYQSISEKQFVALHGHLDSNVSSALSGHPGHEDIWHVTSDGKTIRFLSAWTIHNGKALLATYTADAANFDAALPDVLRVFKTIRYSPLEAQGA
jgi:hypothetical protein